MAFLLYGSLHDTGWDSAQNKAIEELKTEFGDKIQITYKLNVPESPQSSQVMDGLIQDGYKLIFGTSFGYSQYMAAQATRHPDVRFEGYECSVTLENMACFDPDFPVGFYLSGMAAGGASKTGKLGITGGLPVPNNIAAINQFELGAQRVNPGATTNVVYINSWFDPAKGSQAAKGLLSNGADVLGTMLNSPETGQAAAKGGAFFIGRDFAGQQSYAPAAWLTGSLLNWTPYYSSRIKAMLDGSWKTQKVLLPYSKCCELADFGPAYKSGVSTQDKAAIEEVRKEVAAGTFEPFKGPIYDNKGKLRVPEGKTLTPQERSAMDWYVKGVVVSDKG